MGPDMAALEFALQEPTRTPYGLGQEGSLDLAALEDFITKSEGSGDGNGNGNGGNGGDSRDTKLETKRRLAALVGSVVCGLGSRVRGELGVSHDVSHDISHDVSHDVCGLPWR